MPDLCPMSVMFTSSDMKRSIAFYKDVLGFELRECWPDQSNPRWASVVLGGQSVMLGEKMDAGDVEKQLAENPACEHYVTLAREFSGASIPGAGVLTYLMVDDVDQYHATITNRGARTDTRPTDQFYGIRDFAVRDPDGYRLIFYKVIKMSSCQSCGMPLQDAKEGQMYCHYCVDENGKLKPYEEVLEGTVTGYFMGMQNMPRDRAEHAAKEHLAKMPAWKGVC